MVFWLGVYVYVVYQVVECMIYRVVDMNKFVF